MKLLLLLVAGFPSYTDSLRTLQDDCSASVLSIDDDDQLTLTGSNVNASEDVLSCTASYRHVVYYQFVATGSRYRVSTCHSQTDFATELVVGTGICEDVGCTNFGASTDDDCETVASAVEFFSEENQMYTIAVTGNDTGVVGTFGLTLKRFRRPPNDDCSGSVTLQPSTSVDPLLFASTENATANVLSCESEQQVGVYYGFVGTGARFRVSTCHAETTFRSTLVVSDSPCVDIGCGLPYEAIVEEDCDVAPGNGYTLEFRSEEGVNYTIGVRGTEGLTGSGEFGLSLVEYVRPNNDICASATAIELKDGKAFLSGSTENATISEFSCYAETYPTMFYEVIGTGETLHVSTCFEPSFNTSILITEGSCDNGLFSACGSDISLADFTCDSELGYASTASTTTIEGETYTIAVTGVVPSEKGAFSLQVQMDGKTFTPMTNHTDVSTGDEDGDGGGDNAASDSGSAPFGRLVVLIAWFLTFWG